MMAGVKRTRLRAAIVEMADDLHRLGIIDEARHKKITLRDVGKDAAPVAEPLTGTDIRMLRERTRMSQAVFARTLNLSVGYVSQLERGTKQPTGAALVLLDVIRRKGLEAIL
jgi:putative transcriptional regulator